ncbi:MAG: DUF5681 domain-containing protein [Vicinamibacterales bacterium]
MSGDDEIGFGRPPKKTRFKPGQSGNPKGRPPRSRNLKTNVIEELRKTVSIREGSKERRVSKVEAIAIRLVNRALNNDPKAIEAILKIDERVEKEGGGRVNHDLLSAEERDVFDLLLNRAALDSGVPAVAPTPSGDTASTTETRDPDDGKDNH